MCATGSQEAVLMCVATQFPLCNQLPHASYRSVNRHGDVLFPGPIRGTRPSPSCTIHIDTQPPAKHDALDRRQMATVAGTPHCFSRSSGTPTRRHRQSRAPGGLFQRTSPLVVDVGRKGISKFVEFLSEVHHWNLVVYAPWNFDEPCILRGLG